MDKEEMMNNSLKELNTEQTEQVFGGLICRDAEPVLTDRCKHRNKVKTGDDREDSRFIFWSKHQYEYTCPDCGKTFWVDEERN